VQPQFLLRAFSPAAWPRLALDFEEAALSAERSCPWAYPSWAVALLAAVALIDIFWLAFTPLSFGPSGIPLLVTSVLLVGVARLVLRRVTLPTRVQMLLAGMSLIVAAWPILRLFNHLVMTTAFPLADARLAAWDSALGFDWLGYVSWVDSQPALRMAMEVAYHGLDAYSCLGFLLLLWLVGVERAREFTLLILLTAVAATAIGMFFPAEAAMAWYAPPPGTFETLTPSTGGYHLAALDALRTDPDQALVLHKLPGLTTFPSFHTATGLVCIYCSRGSRVLFVPMLVLNALMISATPVFGSHYFVDVLAGALLTLGAVLLLRALPTAAVLNPLNARKAGDEQPVP
jgi:hypothetical protein